MNEIGVAEFYKGSWEEKGHQVVNSIGCADCHDAKTMNLHISRPALVEALRSYEVSISPNHRIRICAH
jgi:nitrite reductase (cytochrome c-552)